MYYHFSYKYIKNWNKKFLIFTIESISHFYNSPFLNKKNYYKMSELVVKDKSHNLILLDLFIANM
jgi:hypothetical protein